MLEQHYEALSPMGKYLVDQLSQLPIEQARKLFHKDIHQKRSKIKRCFMVENGSQLLTVGHKFKHIHNH